MINLGKNVELAFEGYARDVEKTSVLTVQEERELIQQVDEGNEGALQKLITSNLRLVLKIAYKYRKSNFSFSEIIQEGNMGLIHAASRFDAKRNVRFSTYATWWIRSFIQRYLDKHQQLIYVPPRRMQRINKIRENVELSEKNKSTNSSTGGKQHEPFLDYPKVVHDSEDLNYVSLYEDRYFSPETILDRKMDRELIIRVMQMLKDHDRDIAEMCFPLDGSKPESTATIARSFQTTPGKIRSVMRRTRKILLEVSEYAV